MNLFAFQPKGHGEQSFFVMAETLEEAKSEVEKIIAGWRDTQNSERGLFFDLDADGWGTDYYQVTIAGRGAVVMNDND